MALIIFFAAVAALTVFVSMKKSGHFLKSFFQHGAGDSVALCSQCLVRPYGGQSLRQCFDSRLRRRFRNTGGNNEFDSADYNDKIKYLLIYD